MEGSMVVVYVSQFHGICIYIYTSTKSAHVLTSSPEPKQAHHDAGSSLYLGGPNANVFWHYSKHCI